jgi:hypothetical protein
MPVPMPRATPSGSEWAEPPSSTPSPAPDAGPAAQPLPASVYRDAGGAIRYRKNDRVVPQAFLEQMNRGRKPEERAAERDARYQAMIEQAARAGAAAARAEMAPRVKRSAENLIRASGGYDGLAAKLGRTGALETIADARGRAEADRVAANWAGSDPVPRQITTQYGGDAGYESDPLHDQRVIATLGPGVPDHERQRVIAEVTAEYRQAALDKAERQQAGARPDWAAAPGAGLAHLPSLRQGGNVQGKWDPVSHTLIPPAAGQHWWAQWPDHSPATGHAPPPDWTDDSLPDRTEVSSNA